MTSRLRDEFEDLDSGKKATVCRALVTMPLVRIHRGNVNVNARLAC
ncbi:hypothetical protein LGN17_24265 [Burkholderia sp. AU30280]|nr:hypothetical protein [Burkholderia sp. AU30280]MCA8275603.1 hypothetical protein [Burkholderia sp. AU30280]